MLPPVSGLAFLISLGLGAIGFVLAYYGKRLSRPPHLMAGLVLMIFPYFAPNVLITLVVGFVVMGALGFAVRAGL